jgi:DNA-binding transcriptional regulator YdaS (Cro superfamily)
MKEASLIKSIKAAGGSSALAAVLGISQEAVSQWRRVPVARVLDVERVTGISRHDLRPDIYPRDEITVPTPAAEQFETQAAE